VRQPKLAQTKQMQWQEKGGATMSTFSEVSD
jgi:hypothetical protein